MTHSIQAWERGGRRVWGGGGGEGEGEGEGEGSVWWRQSALSLFHASFLIPVFPFFQTTQKESKLPSFHDIVDEDERAVEQRVRAVFVGWLVESLPFRVGMLTVILLNSIVIGVQTDRQLVSGGGGGRREGGRGKVGRREGEGQKRGSGYRDLLPPPQEESYGAVFLALDKFFLTVFVMEILAKWYSDFLGFWALGWNIFDFVIVAASILGPSECGAVTTTLHTRALTHTHVYSHNT